MNLTMPFKVSTDMPVNGFTSKLDDIRHTLSQEADHLAEVAAQFSREAGTHASKLADDAASQAGRVAHDTGSHAASLAHDPVVKASGFGRQLLRGTAGLGTALAVSSRKTAHDLRNVRITTEPRKTGPDFMPGIALLGGFGAGIALMYFMDPEQGERRRKKLGDRLIGWTRRAGNRTVGAIRQTSKQVQGAMAGSTEATLDSEEGSWQTTDLGNGYESSDYDRSPEPTTIKVG